MKSIITEDKIEEATLQIFQQDLIDDCILRPDIFPNGNPHLTTTKNGNILPKNGKAYK